MSRSRCLLATAALLALLATPSTSKATLLNVGDTGIPLGNTFVSGPAFSTDTLLNTVSGTFSSTVLGVTLSGSYTAEVLQTNPISGPQTLDFAYQVMIDSSANDKMGRFTAIVFGPQFTTDVIALSTSAFGFTSGGVAPVSGDRDTTTIGFNYTGGTQLGVQPGQNTEVMVIRTNATAYTVGAVNLIDGATSTKPAFAPTIVPEPATLASALLGLPVVLLFRKLRRKA